MVQRCTKETVSPTFVIAENGVKVVFPKILYSAPVLDQPWRGPALEKGKSTSLRALIKPVGSGAVSWRVSGGWRTVGANLVAPARATTCVVTMRQAMTAKPKATSKTVHPVVS